MRTNELVKPRDSEQRNTREDFDSMIGRIFPLIAGYSDADSAKKKDSIAAHLTEMICEMDHMMRPGQELSEREIRCAVDRIYPELSIDCIRESEHNPNVRRGFEGVVWRTGLLFAIFFSNSPQLPSVLPKHILFLVCELCQTQKPVPDRALAVKLLDFSGHTSPETLDGAVRGILSKMGYMTRNQVQDFGHPIDIEIVHLLDTPLVQSTFRSLVNVNADTAMGQTLAASIPVTAKNFPELNAVVDECTARIGIRRPYTVVSNRINGLNAMTFGSDDSPYLMLSSLMVRIMNMAQLRFVVGHECGHIAMGHVVCHTAVATFGSLSQLIPIVGTAAYKSLSLPLNAWSRRSEITADRAGLFCCDDVELAKKTLLQLECGFLDAEEIDMEAYLSQSMDYLKTGALRKLGEYGSSHPLTTKRIAALDLFANSVPYYNAIGKTAPEHYIDKKELDRETEAILKIF